jgi:hypothetical protein
MSRNFSPRKKVEQAIVGVRVPVFALAQPFGGPLAHKAFFIRSRTLFLLEQKIPHTG